MLRKASSAPFVAALLLLVMCKPDPPTQDGGSDTGDTSTGGEPSPYTELDPEIGGGVLLSAANVGDALVFVGGQLSSAPGVDPGGPGYLVRWQNGQLCTEANVSTNTLWWIDAPSANEWYAVGEQGTIVHQLDGTRTDESVETSAVLYGVFDQGDRVHAVGGDVWDTKQGEIWERNASGEWSAIATELPGVVFKVWREWFVGVGVAWVLEGDTLVERPVPDEARLLTVHGNDAGDVWAVGGLNTPTMLQWVDGAWNSVAVDPACANSGLNGVWVSEDGDVWIAGAFGGFGVLRQGGQWECPPSKPTREHFHGVRGHQDDVFFAGGNLLSAGNNYGTLIQYREVPSDGAPGTIAPCG